MANDNYDNNNNKPSRDKPVNKKHNVTKNVKFDGACEALKGVGFECNVPKQLAKFPKTLEKIAIYVGTNMDADIAKAVLNLQYLPTAEPTVEKVFNDQGVPVDPPFDHINWKKWEIQYRYWIDKKDNQNECYKGSIILCGDNVRMN